MQPTLVAEWAGHSVQVLLRVYAKCIEGQDAQSRQLIENALGEPKQAKPQDETGKQEEPEAAREGDEDEA